MEHRAYLSYNEKEFTDWANTVGHSTTAVVKYFLGGKEPERGYKYCASLTKLCDRYGSVRLLRISNATRTAVWTKPSSCDSPPATSLQRTTTSFSREPLETARHI